MKCPYHGQASETFLTANQWTRRYKRPPVRSADVVWTGTDPWCKHWLNPEIAPEDQEWKNHRS